MKTSNLFLAIAMVMGSFTSFSQGSGKVTLKAEIEAENENPDMQISVINLSSKDLIDRQTVSTRYFTSFDLGNRYMLYFKKEGHPSTRLIVDTNVPELKTYYVHVNLNLTNLNEQLETGISMAMGTLAFNSELGGFDLQTSGSEQASLLAVTYRGVEAGVANF